MTTDDPTYDELPMSEARALRISEQNRIREAEARAKEAWLKLNPPPPDPAVQERETLDAVRREVLLRHPNLDNQAVDRAAQRIINVDRQREVDLDMAAREAEQVAAERQQDREVAEMYARVEASRESDALAREAARAEADRAFDASRAGRHRLDAEWLMKRHGVGLALADDVD